MEGSAVKNNKNIQAMSEAAAIFAEGPVERAIREELDRIEAETDFAEFVARHGFSGVAVIG